MPYKYIGKTTSFKGKTLWEILGNLKNYGVGRIVARSIFERYPEPTYYKVLSVKTLANPVKPSLDEERRVEVVVEKVFRGKLYPEPWVILRASYKADFRLIPKEEEESYCKRNVNTQSVKILPKTMEFPPLMKEFIIREAQSQGQKIEEPRLEVAYCIKTGCNVRVAEEGEKPTVEVTPGLGKPASPDLYKGLPV